MQENRELHELIMELRDDVQQKLNEVVELKLALDAAREGDTATLNDQVKRLTVQETKLGRALNAKQSFCESLVTENERLKETLQSVKNERITEVSSLREQLGKLSQSSPDVKKVLEQVAFDSEDGSEVRLVETPTHCSTMSIIN